ncbi:hypothetical protein [Paenibacillus naphthalenovorans]|uniref:hypothetical protein n=1 Tax=Paenibacillus naphthalenovorans TaxID=162209 RepID=UPI003D2C129A
MNKKQNHTNMNDSTWYQPLKKADQLLKAKDPKITTDLKNYFLKTANFSLLFRVQMKQKLWEDLLSFPDVFFRRLVCANAYNLSEKMISEAIGISTGSAHNLLNNSREPSYNIIHTFAVMVNVPWQLLIEERPVEKSYSAPTEYFYNGSAEEKQIEELLEERSKVSSIKGYQILNPEYLFDREPEQVTGRWVRSLAEMEYFEFHLDREPVLHKQKIEEIFKLFPFATHLVTTYTPFRQNKRSLWVLGPKPGKEKKYQDLLYCLKMRDSTIVVP